MTGLGIGALRICFTPEKATDEHHAVLSFSCGIGAAVCIALGTKRTKKTAEVEARLERAFELEAQELSGQHEAVTPSTEAPPAMSAAPVDAAPHTSAPAPALASEQPGVTVAPETRP